MKKINLPTISDISKVLFVPRMFNPFFYIFILIYLLAVVFAGILDSIIEWGESVRASYRDNKHRSWSIKHQRWLTNIQRWELKEKEIIAADKYESIDAYIKLAKFAKLESEVIDLALDICKKEPEINNTDALLKAYRELTHKGF
jgi:hypothetical protein